MTGRNRQISRWLSLAVLAAALPCFLTAAEDATEPNKPATVKAQHPPFEDFRVIIDRNMFGTANKAAPGAPDAASQEQQYSQTVRLIGTWIEGDEAEALFESNPGQEIEKLEYGDSIAEYTVMAICTETVALHSNQGDIELKVGSGLGKEGDGPWTLIEQVPPVGAAAVTATPPQSPPPPAATTNTGQNQNPEHPARFGRHRMGR
jgi:hypothetical protein